MKDAMCGDVEIPSGDYWVALGESGQITLSAGGKTRKIPAVKRRTGGRAPKRVEISFFCGGGNTWSLVITTPKQGQWVSLIELSKRKEK